MVNTGSQDERSITSRNARRNQPEVLYKKNVLKNSTQFTLKDQQRSPFLEKLRA